MLPSSSDQVTASRDGHLRVLVAHNAYQHRGGEDVVVDAEVSLLRARGHSVALYQRHNDELHDRGALAAAKDSVWSSRTGADVARLVAEFQPDVIHVHNTFAVISPSLYGAAARARVPVVQTLHNFRLLCLDATFLRDGQVCEDCLGRFPWRGVWHRCCRGSASQSAVLATMIGVHRAMGTYRNKVSRYIALTDFGRAKFIAGGLPAARIAVKSPFAEVPPYDQGQPRSGGLFVGRLSPEKGTRVLARAAATRPNAVLDVIGDGPERSSLEGAPGIRLIGWKMPGTVHARMQQAIYLVLPSVALESFPMTVVEAFACGLPVIASRLGALAEIIKDGATGLLFEAGNAEDLTQKLAWAEANPEAMAQMGRAARHEYELKYTPDRNYAVLMDIYRAALNTLH